MSESYNFRTAFNGFHREDVVHYLQYIQNKHTGQLNQLRAELENAQKDALAAAQLQEVLEDLRAQYGELEAERDAALARVQELEQEVIALRSKKSEAAASGVDELEAYRRAERTERQAQQRAEQLLAQAHGVLADAGVRADENAQRIGAMADQAAAQLAALQQAVIESKAGLQETALAMYAIRPQE